MLKTNSFIDASIWFCLGYIRCISKFLKLPEELFPTTTLSRRGGGSLPCHFLKIESKCPDFAKKSAQILEKALFVGIYRLNSHLKCSFKSTLEKNTKLFHCGALSLFVGQVAFIKVLLFQETSPAPNFPLLVARLFLVYQQGVCNMQMQYQQFSVITL